MSDPLAATMLADLSVRYSGSGMAEAAGICAETARQASVEQLRMFHHTMRAAQAAYAAGLRDGPR